MPPYQSQWQIYSPVVGARAYHSQLSTWIWTLMVPNYAINVHMQRLSYRSPLQWWWLGSTFVSIKSPLMVLCNDGYVLTQRCSHGHFWTLFVTWSSNLLSAWNYSAVIERAYAAYFVYNRLTVVCRLLEWISTAASNILPLKQRVYRSKGRFEHRPLSSKIPCRPKAYRIWSDG